MQIIKCFEDIASLQDNRIIGGENISFHNSEIRFSGKGNVLFCEESVNLYNSQLKFNGDNCIIYLSENCHAYYLDVTVYINSVFFIGKDNYLNGQLHAVLSEQKNVIIGNENLFSFGVWVRTADPHLVYSAETKKRINPSKSVLLGDRVWIGQAAMILKGSTIGSGSILGAMSLLSGKKIPSNTSWGGNPARHISDGVFWSTEAVHMWDDEETAAHEMFEGEPHIFTYVPKEQITVEDIDSALKGSDVDNKLIYLKRLSASQDKNRFAVQAETKTESRGKLWRK